MARRGRVGSDLVYTYLSWSPAQIGEIDLVKRSLQQQADDAGRRLRVTRSEVVRHMWGLYVTPVIRKKIETAKTQTKALRPIEQKPKDIVVEDVGAQGVITQEQKLQFNSPPKTIVESELLD